jgi:arylsulfatase A-like enzyme
LALLISIFKLYKLNILAEQIDWRVIFAILRGDLFSLLVFGIVFAFWLDRTSGWWQKTGILLLHTLCFVVLLTIVFEHGYFLVTGAIPDWHLMKYLCEQYEAAAYMIYYQITLERFPLLFVPILINMLPIWLAKIPAIHRWLNVIPSSTASSDHYVMSAWAALVSMAAITGLSYSPKPIGAATPLTYGFFTYIFYHGLVVRSFPEERVADKKAAQMPPIFDAHNLRLKATPQSRRKNVVVIFLESVRTRSITPYNPQKPTTPFLAQLGSKSLQYQNFYALLPHTSKSLVTSLCGFYPKLVMKIAEAKPNAIPGRCLPHLLGDHGYRTAFFQPTALLYEQFDQLTKNIGFQDIFGDGQYPTPEKFEKINTYGREDMIMFEPSLQWVDSIVSQNKPFFLNYLTLITHFEYDTPRSFPTKKYTDKDPDLNKYLNAMRYLDKFLEKLFEAFRQRGLLDSTVFVLLGDHGESFGEHTRRQHDTAIFEEQLHIPMFLHHTKLWPKAQKIEGLRQQIDLVPTIADVLQMPLEGGHLPGISLLRPVSPERKLYFNCAHERYCIGSLKGSRKIIYNYTRTPIEVYDLQNDPYERVNLANQEPHAQNLAAEIEDLLLWRARVNRIYDLHSAALNKTNSPK